MSRSNPTDHAQNPASRFFDWAGGKGELVYYDREKKENVPVELPFRFLILDEVATVGGGLDDDNGYIGYWSNAIRPRDAKVAELTVRSSSNGKTRIEYSGLWSDIKAHLTGAKYVKGLYIAFVGDDDQLQLGYLKIRGAAMRPWIDFTNEHKDIYAGAFSITGKEQKKKGTNTFYQPVFGYTDKITEERNEAALALDRDVLQPYLTAYFAQQGVAVAAAAAGGTVEYSGVPEPTNEQVMDAADYDDDIPF